MAARVYTVRKGIAIVLYQGHHGIIFSCCYSPDDTHIATTSNDNSVQVWSATNGRRRFLLRGHNRLPMSSAYTSDGRRLISNDEQAVRIWDMVGGQCVAVLEAAQSIPRSHYPLNGSMKPAWTYCCAAPGVLSKKYVIVGSNTGTVYCLHQETGREEVSWQCKTPCYNMCSGGKSVVVCGDLLGNVYVVKLQASAEPAMMHRTST